MEHRITTSEHSSGIFPFITGLYCGSQCYNAYVIGHVGRLIIQLVWSVESNLYDTSFTHLFI